MQLLGGLTTETFLRDYWQKKPLLIRQAIPDFNTPLSPDELAGLACETEVESRLILEKHGPAPWYLEHGPFDETRFAHLPTTHWTLLIQKANQLLPELAELLELFNFIPSWRVDDVMVSYASAHGSVGPHVDQYDVFLLQGLGTRRWQITTQDTSQSPLWDNTELQILQEFMPEKEWELMPGDMLYLPPNVAHYGVALNDCMTFSIGFRAPCYSELLSAWTDDQLVQLPAQLHYQDHDLQPQVHCGEIDAAAQQRIQAIIRQQFIQDEDIDRWIGHYITEPATEAMPLEPELKLQPEQFEAQLIANGELYRSEYSRFAFLRNNTTVWLYVDGQEFEFTSTYTELISLLCDQRRYQLIQLAPHLPDSQARELLTTLYNMGAVEFPHDA
jgi:50S ribosomal protein L16 3-hydroxylase